MSFLRSEWGIDISIYMDDMLLQAETEEKAHFHAQLTILLLQSLGLEVNFEKSTLSPSQRMTPLGFDINSTLCNVSCVQ